MLTLFSIPKAFTGRTAIQQRNAIASWTHLDPSCEVILFGDDPGVGDAAAALGARHAPEVDTNSFGTPLLSSVFASAQRMARHELMMYVNADIIFVDGLLETLRTIRLDRFLACGRRRDLDVESAIDFSRPEWAAEVKRTAEAEGRWHGLSGLDYFVFRRGSVDMRPFAVGRPGWDSWLIYEMRRRRIPVIDASGAVLAIHQNHDYSHSRFGEKERVGGPEFEANMKIAGGRGKMMTLRDADWVLTPAGPAPLPFPASLRPMISAWYPSRLLLAALRAIRS